MNADKQMRFQYRRNWSSRQTVELCRYSSRAAILRARQSTTTFASYFHTVSVCLTGNANARVPAETKRSSDLNRNQNSSGDEIANVNFYAVHPKLPEFAEITRNNAVINSNLPHILHRFRDIAVDRSEIAILGYPSCV